MKHSLISLLLIAGYFSLASSGCSKSQPLPGISDTTQSVQTQTTGDAVNRVASDKELLRQTLVLADHKGTLESALTEAAQDSLVGIKMREALVLGYEAKTKTVSHASRSASASHTASSDTNLAKSHGAQ